MSADDSHADPVPIGDMGAGTPLVSVVLPVFNGGPLLTEALRSLTEQTFRDFEVVVVDDGSTDDTADRIALEAARDRRIRCIRHSSNQGLLVSLADGLAAASGEFIARLDADDLCLPQRFAEQVAALRADASRVLCWTAYERWELDTGNPLGVIVPPTEHAAMQMGLARANRILHSSVMFRADSVRALGGYRTEWYPAEDYDLWCRLLQVGVGVGISRPLVVSRVNPRGISLSNVAVQAEVASRRAAAEQDRYGRPATEQAATNPRARVRAQHRLAAAVLLELRTRGMPAEGLLEESLRTSAQDLRETHRLLRWAIIASVSPLSVAKYCWTAIAMRARG